VQPPAAQINTRRVVAIGTGLWFVAFVALLADYSWLTHHGHRIWLWTAFAGWLLGLLGYALVLRHRGMGRTS
jgi:hypothetical protein